ncbi:DUF6879 family protein [Pilimelia anulata]|nr:DUF6879 family protein [Pilimelia anulata]
MHLTFIGKDPGSEPSGSPTLYRTDRGSLIVQGWVVTDHDALAAMDIPAGESDFYVFDDRLALFLHYAGAGTNASFETTTDPDLVGFCRRAFEEVWRRALPADEFRSRQ